MTKVFTLFGLLAAVLLLSGCGNQKDNFALPPGDVERGKKPLSRWGVTVATTLRMVCNV